MDKPYFDKDISLPAGSPDHDEHKGRALFLCFSRLFE